MAGLLAADAAAVVGLRGHGLRGGRRAGRAARRAGPARGGRVRRRRLPHGLARRRHRGGIRHPRHVGRVEQLRLRVDPGSAARRLRQGDDDDVQPRGDGRALLAGLRAARARVRRRRGTGDRAGRAGDALAAAVRSDRPTVVDVVVDPSTSPIATGTWQLLRYRIRSRTTRCLPARAATGRNWPRRAASSPAHWLADIEAERRSRRRISTLSRSRRGPGARRSARPCSRARR